MTLSTHDPIARMKTFQPGPDPLKAMRAFLDREDHILSLTRDMIDLSVLITQVMALVLQKPGREWRPFFMKGYISLYERDWAEKITRSLPNQDQEIPAWSREVQAQIKRMTYPRTELPPLENVLRQAVLHRHAVFEYQKVARDARPINHWLTPEKHFEIIQWLQRVTIELAEESPGPAAQRALRSLDAALTYPASRHV